MRLRRLARVLGLATAPAERAGTTLVPADMLCAGDVIDHDGARVVLARVRTRRVSVRTERDLRSYPLGARIRIRSPF